MRNILLGTALSIVLLSGCSGSSSSTTPIIPLVFTNGQAASVVIGQPDFTTATAGTTASELNRPQGVSYNDQSFFITDNASHRVLGYNTVPSSNGASADFVLGQSSMTGSSPGTGLNQMTFPQNAVVLGKSLFITEDVGARITVWTPVPSSMGGSASYTLGNGTLACTATQMNPEMVVLAGNKLVVTDSGQNRLLIYNSVPTNNSTSPDLVLGQTNFTSCSSGATASLMNAPAGVWSNGTKLVVVDLGNNRVLIWNTFPAQNGQAADLVLGQTSFTGVDPGTTASTFSHPWGVTSNGVQLFVTDESNHRILIWNTFPTQNGQAADVVLGQTDFISAVNSANATAAGLQLPIHVAINQTARQIAVADYGHSRVLLYNSK